MSVKRRSGGDELRLKFQAADFATAAPLTALAAAAWAGDAGCVRAVAAVAKDEPPGTLRPALWLALLLCLWLI